MAAWKRRLVMGTAGCTASAALAGAGCVFAVRRQKEIYGRRDEVMRALTCDAATHRSASSSAIFKDAFKKLRLNRDQFRAAASHMYPIEKLVENWRTGHATAEEVQQLCEKWGDAANESLRIRAKFGKRISHNAQGVDIGTPVEPYFEHGALDDQLRTDVAESLKTYGACYLKNALTPELLGKIRDALLMRADTRHKSAREMAKRLIDEDPNVTSNRYTLGRLHCLLRGSVFEAGLACAHPPFLPIVYDFFRECLPPTEERLVMSELQVIITEPMAWEQIWHVDNAHRGLTLLIPLERIESQGSQLLLPGTHRSFQEAWQVLSASEGPISHPDVWEAGDAWILDSRTMRRGKANSSAYETIPMLVIRYDLSSTMPPGQHVWETRALVHKGRILESLFSL